jgi:16S rRNA U1498 N3-methylase RsmE
MVNENKECSFDMKRVEEIFNHLIRGRKIKLNDNHTIFITNSIKGKNIISDMTHEDMIVAIVLSLNTRFRKY